MTGPFAWFIAHGLRNRMLRQARRLRSPRYAIAALVGALYFFLIFGGSQVDATIGRDWVALARMAGPLMLGLLASWWWLWGGHRYGLVLTPAETHLLLPAPVSRTQLIRFKILQAQPAILFSALLVTLVMRGTGLPWPMRLLSVWLLLATLHQHQIAASLVHAAAAEHGRYGLRRNIVAVVLFGIGFSTLVWSLFSAIGDMRAAGSLGFAGERLIAVLDEPGPRIVLAPFRLLLAPLVATSAGDWLLPAAGACVVLIAHYLWIVRTDAAFEETAAAVGQQRAEVTSAVRSGGFSRLQFARRKPAARTARSWLPLHPSGRGAYAIFWKNVLYSQRSIRSARSFMMVVIVVAVVVSMSGRDSGSGDMLRFVGIILLSLGAAVSLFGPFAIRNDLRMDLLHIDLLRTFPVPGRDLVAAEIAAATLTMCVPQIVLMTAGALVLTAGGVLDAMMAVVVIGTAVLLLPMLNALAVLVQNVLALLYPSWARLGGHDAGGMEVIGQNMIVMVGTLLILALCALPPLLVGALVGAPLTMLIGGGAILIGIAAAMLAAVAEVALIIMWLGRLYERTDPVAAGLLR